MSADLVPTLPGSAFPKRAQLWSTTVQEAAGGRQTTISWWSYPKWSWDLPIDLMRQYGLFSELSQIASFYAQHYGRGDTWLFREPNDCTETAQMVGILVTTDLYTLLTPGIDYTVTKTKGGNQVLTFTRKTTTGFFYHEFECAA